MYHFSTHARTPRIFKYLKRAGRSNFRVYFKKIVSKRHDDYQYSPLEAARLNFFFPVMSFILYFLTGRKQQRPTPFRCLKTYSFRACVEENNILVT